MKISKKRKMLYSKAWRYIRNTAAVIGAIMIYGAIGTDDFYTTELLTEAPQSVETGLIIGFALLIPTILHILKKSGERLREWEFEC